MMAHSGKIAFAAGALWLAAALPVHAATAPVTVKWPQGWTVRQAPLPANAPEGSRPDVTQTAVKSRPDGAPIAAISLMTIDIQPGDPAQLDQEAPAMLDTIQGGYTDKGLKASCDAPVKTKLGALPALQSTCQVQNAKNVQVVKQVVIIAVGAQEVYGLTYAAAPASFDAYRGDFTQVANGLSVH